MGKLTQVAESMQKVLSDVADKAGRETGFVKRESKLTGSLFSQTLVFGWLANPEASLEQLTQTAAALGVEISPQGLEQRFTKEAADCLKQVLEAAIKQAIAAEPVAIPILARFTGVNIFDSSQVSLPSELKSIWNGNGGSGPDAALKFQVGMDLSTGELTGPLLQAGKASDKWLHKMVNLAADSLRITDLGYFDLDEFANLANKNVYWLSRIQPHTGMKDDAGKYWQVIDFLEHKQLNKIEMSILLGASHQLPCRLFAVRVPPQVAETRRRRLRRDAKKRGYQAGQKALAMADWTVFVTNAPAQLLSLDEALIIARARWQIELLFKLWKSHGQIDQSRSEKPWRILCEVYAKLIAMLIQHWVLIVSCWAYPNRSLFKAAQTVQKMALTFASVFGSIKHICAVIATIQRCLAKG